MKAFSAIHQLFRAAGWISSLTVLIAIGAVGQQLGGQLAQWITSPDTGAVLQALIRYAMYAVSIGIVLIPTWPAAFMGALIVGGFHHALVAGYFIIWAGAILISATILANPLYLTLSTLVPTAAFWIKSPLEIRKRAGTGKPDGR
jgi:hypothetical protein